LSIGGLVGGANIIDEIFGFNLAGNAAGMVNRDRITAEELRQAISAQTQQARNQFGELTDRLLDQAENQAWDNLVANRLLIAQFQERELEITGDEIFYVLQHYPPIFLQQNEAFQTDGIFDLNLYYQALNNPSGNEWAPVEAFLANLLPGEKLSQMIRAMAFTSEEEIKASWYEREARATVDFIYVANNKISLGDMAVDEDEIRVRYRRDREDYAVSERRILEYVIWPKTPTAADSASVVATAVDLVNRAQAGEDFARLALDFSEDPGSGPSGGELGWFGKGQMVPAFDSAVFGAQPGYVVGPIRTQFGYHVIKVHEVREQEDGPQVNASHILLKVALGPGSLDQLRNQANIFSYDAADSSFETALKMHALEARTSSGLREADKYLPPPVGMMRSVVRFAFGAEVGDLSDVYANDNCFLVARLNEVLPAGYQPIEEVSSRIQRTIKQEAAAEQVDLIMANMRYQLDTTSSWQALADSIPEAVYFGGVTSSLNGSFKGVGRSPMLTGVITSLAPGEVSPVVHLERGQAVVRLVDLAEPDWSAYEAQREAAHERLLEQRTQAAWNIWLDDLKDQAEIIDNRHRFF
ncbi:MAG: peptidylprolyl isomerase, partial [Candidatus Marinimicrobia bacterium]|nr:peptidylprolyl isomerase [Candidatus Neomarinimicrobiota bacterium]